MFDEKAPFCVYMEQNDVVCSNLGFKAPLIMVPLKCFVDNELYFAPYDTWTPKQDRRKKVLHMKEICILIY